jgi:hypothetical protein
MKICTLTLILFSTFHLFSQTQGSAYTAVGKGVATTFLTDYQCLGVNVSALGWGTGYDKKKFTMGSSEFGFGLSSDVLTQQRLKNFANSIYTAIAYDSAKVINWKDQQAAIAEYAQAGVNLYADYNWGGFSFQGKLFGGIAFNVRENYQWYSKLSPNATNLIVNGKVSNLFDSLDIKVGNITTRIPNTNHLSPDSLKNVVSGTMTIPLHLSTLLHGTDIKMVWNRSYNLGYGRKIFGIDSVFNLYAGIGGRIIKSMAMFDLDATQNGITLHSALTSSFNINYQSVMSGINTVKNYSGGIPPAVGSGYGIDLSVSAIFWNKLKVAMAVNNIGSVTYDRNVYRVKDTLIGNIGINSLTDMNLTKAVNQLLTKGGLLTLEGQEKYKLANAATFRFGASFHIKKILGVGFDLVAPFNSENPGSIKNTVVSFGGDLRPLKWLQLSCGYFGGGIYKNNMPVGINFIMRDGGYEFGVSSRDALSFFQKDAHSLSFAMGFARVRF